MAMRMPYAKHLIQDLLSQAGIRVNGNNPWDVQVLDERFFKAALVDGSLGVGEAYVEKWWDCAQLDEFMTRVLHVSVEERLTKNWNVLKDILLSRIVNFQTKWRASRSIHSHYDLGNDLFSVMLDKRMIYSCGYWKNADTLDEAQKNKLELICAKLKLEPGMHVLDIGCGWGGFAKFAAEEYGVRITGITLSDEQASLARTVCKGLPVDIRLQDYREVKEKFSRVVSIGMFEHVGHKNYRAYMQVVNRCLADDGLFLLHTIGSNITSTWTDPWLNRYIFPGSLIPSIQQIGKAIEGLFVMEDWHNFSSDYDTTLMAWYRNFTTHWKVISGNYDERFFRLWKYYLLSCAGSFRCRKNQLWQVVLSKNGVPGGYSSVR